MKLYNVGYLLKEGFRNLKSNRTMTIASVAVLVSCLILTGAATLFSMNIGQAMEMIEAAGKGVVVYLNQEGRGIGLMEKMKAYKLQEDGLDTVDANVCLGHLADERDYGVGAQILRELGVHKMKLLTNNPVKRVGLEAYGLEIVENVPVETVPNPYNERYLRTKKERMGHTLHFNK